MKEIWRSQQWVKRLTSNSIWKWNILKPKRSEDGAPPGGDSHKTSYWFTSAGTRTTGVTHTTAWRLKPKHSSKKDEKKDIASDLKWRRLWRKIMKPQEKKSNPQFNQSKLDLHGAFHALSMHLKVLQRKTKTKNETHHKNSPKSSNSNQPTAHLKCGRATKHRPISFGVSPNITCRLFSTWMLTFISQSRVSSIHLLDYHRHHHPH